MSKTKLVYWLSEDKIVPGQKYALISIVGPHLPQKCSVWGMKVKYVADSLEKAKAMSARLVKADPEFDIYTVEVGKFFPLQVEPTEIQDIEYQNEQLNLLVKNYLENREQANDQYNERKRKMMKDAIREGKNQQDLLNKQEHPIAVLQRATTFEEKIKKLQEELETVQEDLKLTKLKYNKYSVEEKEQATLEFRKAIEATPNTDVKVDVDSLISRLQSLDSDISDVKNKLNSTNEQNAPNMFHKLTGELTDMQKTKDDLKIKLTNKQLVNEYVNEAFKDSPHNAIQNDVVKTI